MNTLKFIIPLWMAKHFLSGNYFEADKFGNINFHNKIEGEQLKYISQNYILIENSFTKEFQLYQLIYKKENHTQLNLFA